MKPITLWWTRPNQDEVQPVRLRGVGDAVVRLGADGSVAIVQGGDGGGQPPAPDAADLHLVPVEGAWMAVARPAPGPEVSLDALPLVPGVPHLIADRQVLTWQGSPALVTFSYEGPLVIEPPAAGESRDCLLCCRPLAGPPPGVAPGTPVRVASCACGTACHAECMGDAGSCLVCGGGTSTQHSWWPRY